MTQDFFDPQKQIPDELVEQLSQRVFEMMHQRRNRMEFKCQTFRIGPKETDEELARLFNDGWRLQGTERFVRDVLFIFSREIDSTPVYRE